MYRRCSWRKGFTLIELAVVISILGIFATIAIPRFIGYSELAKSRVCEQNRKQLDKELQLRLVESNLSIMDAVFEAFKLEHGGDSSICPSSGEIFYSEETGIGCGVHFNEPGEVEDEGPIEPVDPPGSEIPYL